jgi:hypothetical protein
MSWIIAFRDELWANYPVFYTLLSVVSICCLLRYVYKHEVRMNEQHKYEQRRPFK